MNGGRCERRSVLCFGKPRTVPDGAAVGRNAPARRIDEFDCSLVPGVEL